MLTNPENTNLAQLGIDSLMTIEIKQTIEILGRRIGSLIQHSEHQPNEGFSVDSVSRQEQKVMHLAVL